MKSQVLYPLISIVIIQILSNTPRENWKMLKNEKCMWSSKEYICRDFYPTNHLFHGSLKRKTQKREQKAFLCYKKVLVDDKKIIFHKNVYKSKISAGKCRSS